MMKINQHPDYPEIVEGYRLHADINKLAIDKEYAQRIYNVDGNNSDAVADAVIAYLKECLKTYADSKPTTKGGKIGRVFAKIGSILMKPIYLILKSKAK